MTLLSRIKHLGPAVLALLGTVSCDSLIFDTGEDCSVKYRLKFRYDMNLKFADAFAREVESVSLYAFDQTGKLVWQGSEQGEALTAADYSMQLDLEPGNYRLVAWCGLDGRDSFSLPDAASASRPDDLHCRLNCVSAATDGRTLPTRSDKDLSPLFHGMMDVELPDNDNGEEYVYEMSLTKDTNVFHIILQHLSGEELNAADFEFSIEDCNSWLAYDNFLLRDEPVVYCPWAVYSSVSGAGSSRAAVMPKAIVAELTVNRLLVQDWTKYQRPTLVIRSADGGDIVASASIIDYALLVKSEYNKQMDDQEYLDRADEYTMTFFLDNNNQWVRALIEIGVLSWEVVRNDSDLNG